MVSNSVTITEREYEFMSNRESFLHKYGRHVANETKPVATFGFYLPSLTVVESEQEGGNPTYKFNWQCEDIDIEEDGE